MRRSRAVGNDGKLMGLFRLDPCPENDSSRKSFTCGYFSLARATGLEPATTGSTVALAFPRFAPHLLRHTELASERRPPRGPAASCFLRGFQCICKRFCIILYRGGRTQHQLRARALRPCSRRRRRSRSARSSGSCSGSAC